MDEKIRKAIMGDLTVPLWPTAGRALGLGRSATYEAAKRGDIPTVDMGRKKPVPTAKLRKLLGIEASPSDSPT
jgi:hypothetical protein